MDIPVSVVIDEEAHLYLCFKNSLVKFNQKGELIATRRAYGRGPGELHTVLTCSIDSNFLFVYDDEKKELMKFSKANLDFVESIITGRERVKLIASDDENIYLLNKSSFINTLTALTVYKSKNLTKDYIELEIPKYSYIGATRNGGGMTISKHSGALYYYYLPYPFIWQFTPVTGESEKINIQSKSYRGIDEAELRRLGSDHVEHIKYSFSISRVMGLFFIEPTLILQMTEHGNPWDNEEVAIIIDVYDESIGKIDSFSVDRRVLFYI